MQDAIKGLNKVFQVVGYSRLNDEYDKVDLTKKIHNKLDICKKSITFAPDNEPLISI